LSEPHGDRVARKVGGLEAVIVDRKLMIIPSLRENDPRGFEVYVGGPTGLLVAKLHKVHERLDAGTRRVDNKDAQDVYRLLRGVPVEDFRLGVTHLRNEALSKLVTEEAMDFLRRDFGEPGGIGVRLVVASLAGLEDPGDSRSLMQRVGGRCATRV
jgi:hypothetical protein